MGRTPFTKREAQRLLAVFSAALAHRGPDGEGIFQQDTVGLMHRRLAVIDPEGGSQPITDTAGRALIANAEIYNYKRLKQDLCLEEPTLAFSSNSDCAPILPLYDKHGLAFVNYLRGMFALALYDPDSASGIQRLLLVRDPFGIKPLYYAELESGFFFASEISAINQIMPLLPGAEATLNKGARNALLELQFIPGAETIWHPIKRVLPGEMLIVEAGRVIAKSKQQALNDATINRPPPANISIESAITELDAILQDSLSVHLQSDVPVGLFLSGGIDSSTVLTVATEDLGHTLHTFTIGFPDSDTVDEREQARLYAANSLITHYETTFTKNDFWCLLPQVVQALDDPVADYAALPVFKLASIARDYVKVILTGEGGDEIFAGYDQYQQCLMHKDNMIRLKESAGYDRLVRAGLLQERKLRAFGFLERVGLLSIPTAGWRSQLDQAEREENHDHRTYLQRLQAVDIHEWLPHDLLTKIDRCLMWHGLEGRTPLVDINVSRFAFALPDRLKIDKGVGKVILRRWLQARHPKINAFGKKRGLTVPAGHWIQERGGRIGALLSRQPGILEICHQSDIKSFFSDLNKPEQRYASWILLYYALWHQLHVLKQPVQPTVEDTLDQ